jgi:hypothetical protein
MILSQTKCRWVLAVLVSSSFIWTAMACVSLCLLHCSQEECAIEVSATHDKTISFESESSHAGELICTDADTCCQPDCCPMKPLPVCALQKSASFDFQAHNDYQILFINSVVQANSTCINNLQYLIPRSSSDPPFERLCTLRI